MNRYKYYLCHVKLTEKVGYFCLIKPKNNIMDFKEMLFTALAVALGFVVGSIILSKLPANLGGSWEENEV